MQENAVLLKETVGMIVGSQSIRDGFTSTVGVDITIHVVTLLQHIVAQLVKRRCRDHVALAVNLPGDGGVLRADIVVTAVTGGRSGVLGNIHSKITIDDHTTHQVGPEVLFVVDNHEHLGLDTDSTGDLLRLKCRKGFHVKVAKDTIVKGGLILVGGSTGPGSGVRPVNLVGLSNFHELAVLPLVFTGELGIFRVVGGALMTLTDTSIQIFETGTFSSLVVLTNRKMLSTNVPVNIDWAHTLGVIGIGDGNDIDIHVSVVSLGDVSSGLRTNVGHSVDNAIDVGEVELGSGTRVDAQPSRRKLIRNVASVVRVYSPASPSGIVAAPRDPPPILIWGEVKPLVFETITPSSATAMIQQTEITPKIAERPTDMPPVGAAEAEAADSINHTFKNIRREMTLEESVVDEIQNYCKFIIVL